MGCLIHCRVAARVSAQQQHLEINADLFEQFAAARALRCQVDAWLGNHGAKDNPKSPKFAQMHAAQEIAQVDMQAGIFLINTA